MNHSLVGQEKTERGRGWVREWRRLNGRESLSVRSAKGLRALNTRYLTHEGCGARVFLRVLVVVCWLLTSELPVIKYVSVLSSFYLCLSLFSFLLLPPPPGIGCFSILLHQPPILHLHMSFPDISPYREHIKKMYSAAVNHTNPIFSEMKWDERGDHRLDSERDQGLHKRTPDITHFVHILTRFQIVAAVLTWNMSAVWMEDKWVLLKQLV